MVKENLLPGTNVYYGLVVCKVEGHSFFRPNERGCVFDGKDYVYLEDIDEPVPVEDCYGIEFTPQRINEMELDRCGLLFPKAVYMGFTFDYVHELQMFMTSLRMPFKNITE